MGFTETDVRKTLRLDEIIFPNLISRYIRDEAPVIIHFKMDNILKFLVKDTHYRNQFETNTSGGYLSHTSRVDWESNPSLY